MTDMPSRQCLELFSGIGGFAVAATQLGWHVVRAIDIDRNAAAVYRRNFEHSHQIRTIESIPCQDFAALDAELWWLSPPCQPFTRRGVGRGWSDRRSDALRHVLSAIATVRPHAVAVENVPEFMDSSAAAFLRDTLSQCGYQFAEQIVCPTQFGIPNRRRRYYLVASQSRLHSLPEPTFRPRCLRDFLEDEIAGLLVGGDELSGFESAIDCISSSASATVDTISSCFTSAYGKSPVRSGSYLRMEEGLRRFSPREILRLLGFPDSFELPSSLSLRQQWKLVGNSLSVPVVGHFLQQLRT